MRALLAVVFVLGGCGADATTNTPSLDMRMPLNSCMNGLTDDDETDLDCGGACEPCEEGLSCKGATDCSSGICANLVCGAPACDDAVQNGTESDKDCGGSCPNRCAEGQKCNDDADCSSANCVNNVCGMSHCANGKLDNGETDVDCGGSNCTTRCPGGKMCSDGPDCTSGMCINNVCKSACPDGTEDCDGDAGNGCEVNTSTDAINCGLCGNVCPVNLPRCAAGRCEPAAEATIGNSTPFPDALNLSANALLGFSIVIAKPSMLLRFGLVARQQVANVIMALYTDKNGSPDSLATNSPVTLIAGGSQEIQIPSISLKPGTYWLMALFEKDTVLSVDRQGQNGPWAFASQSFANPLPQTFSGMSGAQVPVNFWIVVRQ